MNVYIYEGKDRHTANKSIVANNEQPSIGKEYGVDFTSGILIIAFPNENVATELEFVYWVDPSYTTILKRLWFLVCIGAVIAVISFIVVYKLFRPVK